MKKFLLSAAVVATIFTACKKDDKATTNNFIKIGSETITLAAATDNMGSTFSKGIVFYSIDPYDILTYTGKITTAALSIDTLAEGTYTFKSSFADDYAVSKNFSGFSILANFSYSSNGSQTGGTSYAFPDTGTVVIKKSGSNYSFTYDVKYDSVAVTGQYTGALEK